MMGEPSGDERFGHAVIRTDASELYVLDLYEHPEVLFSGTYLPPSGDILSYYFGSLNERFGPMNMDMVLGDAGLDAMRKFFGDGEVDSAGGGFSFFHQEAELFGPVNIVDRFPNRTVWAGEVSGTALKSSGTCQYVIEQYGSWEIAFLLFVLFYMVFGRNENEPIEANCYRRAFEICGEHNIKSVSVAKRLTATTLRVETECQFECVDQESGA